MKQVTSIAATIWEKTKRTFYALQLVALITAVPVLSFIEWSHGDSKKSEQTNIIEKTPANEVSATQQYTSLKLDFRTI